MRSQTQLLTDPFLQLPMVNSVRVVWFTEFAGEQHLVTYGDHLEKTTIAQTTKLTRVREDQESRVKEQRKKRRSLPKTSSTGYLATRSRNYGSNSQFTDTLLCNEHNRRWGKNKQ